MANSEDLRSGEIIFYKNVPDREILETTNNFFPNNPCQSRPAEGERFELSIRVRAYRISRLTPSTTSAALPLFKRKEVEKNVSFRDDTAAFSHSASSPSILFSLNHNQLICKIQDRKS